eukprot:3705880-Prymnesium_polylepis.1
MADEDARKRARGTRPVQVIHGGRTLMLEHCAMFSSLKDELERSAHKQGVQLPEWGSFDLVCNNEKVEEWVWRKVQSGEYGGLPTLFLHPHDSDEPAAPPTIPTATQEVPAEPFVKNEVAALLERRHEHFREKMGTHRFHRYQLVVHALADVDAAMGADPDRAATAA